MKLTIEQLKNYLGTGLKCQSPSNDTEYRRYANIPVEFDMYGLTDHYAMIDCSVLQTDSEYDEIKPICYRLSDLDKFIPELGFVPIDELQKLYPTGIDTLKGIDYVKESGKWMLNTRRDGEVAINIMWMIYQKLFQWHFWVFDQSYFEDGLVIDKLKMTEK